MATVSYNEMEKMYSCPNCRIGFVIRVKDNAFNRKAAKDWIKIFKLEKCPVCDAKLYSLA